MALVTLPEARLTVLALSTRFAPCPKLTDPLLVSAPDAFSVSTELFEALVVDVLEALTVAVLITALLATVKSPCTATVTFAVANAADNALAVLASIVKPSGSNNQLPVLPIGADALATVVEATESVPRELVSIVPPFPPSFPPIA